MNYGLITSEIELCLVSEQTAYAELIENRIIEPSAQNRVGGIKGALCNCMK